MLDMPASTKRIIQILLLVVLGAGALIVLFVVGRMFVTPPDYLPPTIDPLVPSIDLSVTVLESKHALVSGTTNLPEESILMVSLIEENGNFTSTQQVTVTNGTFQTGQFGPDAGLNFGSYRVEAQTVKAIEQPEAVRERFGPQGVNLVGDLTFQEAQESYAKAIARFEILIPPPVLRSCLGEGIGLIKTDVANSYEITLQAAYKTKTAYGITPSTVANKDYGNEFVFVDFAIRNLDNKQIFLSYDGFVLFLKEGFPFTDFTPFTYYPDSRFTVNKLAKEDGFFGIQEIGPGETFTGRLAFMVPEIAHNFVFSSNKSSCFDQDAHLQCHLDYPIFEFHD